MMIIIALLLSGVVLNTTAQILLKSGMVQIGHFEFAPHNVVPISLKIMTNIPIISGLSCYIFSVVLWLLVLSRTPVSIAYPMASLGYVLNAIAAHYILGESLTPMRLFGIIVILTGVYLIAQTQ